MASPSRLPSRRPVPGKSRPLSMMEGQMLNPFCPPKDSNGTTSKSSKRRSLLPTFSRKASAEERESIREDDEEGGIGSGTNSARDSASIASIPDEPRKATEEARPTREEMDRRAMPPPSKLGRPASTYGAGGLGRAPSVRTHARQPSKTDDARADALAALTGGAPAQEPGKPPEGFPKRTTSTRLPQSPAAKGLSRTSSVRNSQMPPPRTSSLANSRTSTIAEKRTSTVQEKRSSTILEKRTSRPPSIDGSAAVGASGLVSPTSPASSTTSAGQRRARPQSTMLPPSRPAFNTYQQHYSPAKSTLPKPQLPTISRKPVPAAVVVEEEAPTFEVMKQQFELLQLSLVHQASFVTNREYETSAKTKLGKKQAKLRKEYESIRALEEEQQRIANLTALDTWCPDAALLTENLQVLSKVYSELAALTDDQGSRYAQLVHNFSAWTDTAEGTLSGLRAGFISALPQDRHKLHTSLALRLRSLQRDLSTLPPAPQQENDEDYSARSSLEILLTACSTLLDGMLKELEMMSKLEREILQREKARIQEGVKGIDEVLLNSSREPRVPAWQSVA